MRNLLTNKWKLAALLALGPVLFSVSSAHASFLDLAKEAGFMEYVLLLVSITGSALCFQALVTLRAHLLRPPELANELINCVQEGNLDGAVEAAQGDSSFLGTVAFATLSNAQYGKDAMEGAMADAGEIEANKLLHKVGILQLIAAIAPMLGLTGTTVGMIATFAVIAEKADQVTAADMAKGIAIALICTFTGLMVAIPLLAVSFFLKGRVQQVVLEVSNDCNELVRLVSSGEQAEA